MSPIVRNGPFLEALTLAQGSHKEKQDAYCVMEAVAYVAGEPWSDAPTCACPVITTFMVTWNDSLPSNKDRDRLLKPLVPLLVDTRSTKAIERVRSYMALDWFVRVHVPTWFDLTPSLKPSGDALRALDELNSAAACRAAMVTIRTAGKQSAAARAAAGDAARAAAGAAARAAAGAAARAAAWDAARAAAGDAAGDAAWAAAGDAAWAAARAAAGDAAWDAAWAAAGAAARAAAMDAAGAALKPTTKRLQLSAQQLVRDLCLLGRAHAAL